MVTAESDFLKIEDNFAKTKDIRSICMVERTSHQDAKVTIAIPTYNGGEALAQAVNSALAQVGYDDYNILIVDNNPESTLSLSEFSSSVFVDNSEDRRSRISIYCNEQNIGMCGNWNRCLELSKSKWTVMLHDDDSILSNYLKEVMKIVDARPNAGIVQTARTDYHIPNIESAKLPFERFCLLDIFPGGQLHAPTGMLMRTEYIKNLGGWNENHTNLFDYWFSALFLVHYPVYVTPLKLTNYRFSLDRYPHDVRITLLTSEYWLFLKAMLYCGFPKSFAYARSAMLVADLCKLFGISYSDLPFAVSSYSEAMTSWARRYFKYARIFMHKWVNVKDKLQN